MGGGYLPWFISATLTAVIADLIASRSKEEPVVKVALASGIIHVGQAWGAIIPALFFLDKFKEDWVKRGQTLEAMDENIKYVSSYWGVISTVIVFVLAFIGIYVGYFILRKHFKEK